MREKYATLAGISFALAACAGGEASVSIASKDGPSLSFWTSGAGNSPASAVFTEGYQYASFGYWDSPTDINKDGVAKRDFVVTPSAANKMPDNVRPSIGIWTFEGKAIGQLEYNGVRKNMDGTAQVTIGAPSYGYGITLNFADFTWAILDGEVEYTNHAAVRHFGEDGRKNATEWETSFLWALYGAGARPTTAVGTFEIRDPEGSASFKSSWGAKIKP